MIIMTAHDGLALTKACLPTLLAQNGSPRVLCVDNASTDGTYRWLGTQPVERMYGNFRSVSRMWNEALRYCFSEGFERVMVVNNDTRLQRWTYEKLLDQDSDFVTAVGVNNEEQFNGDVEAWRSRDRPDFSCYMISKHCWETMNGFDEEFIGGHFEDNDAHVRLHRLGIRAYCIQMPFFHVGGGTMKTASESEQARIRANFDRNKERFHSMYGCYPSDTQAYDALFTPETFGINQVVSADRA